MDKGLYSTALIKLETGEYERSDQVRRQHDVEKKAAQQSLCGGFESRRSRDMLVKRILRVTFCYGPILCGLSQPLLFAQQRDVSNCDLYLLAGSLDELAELDTGGAGGLAGAAA